MEEQENYLVEIGGKSVGVEHPKGEVELFEMKRGPRWRKLPRGKGPVSEFNEGEHNYKGLKGWVVQAAVEKLYGEDCIWFGEYRALNRGQVVKLLESCQANPTMTGPVVVSVD